MLTFQSSADTKYPAAIRKRVDGDWNCPKCQNLNFSFRDRCNKCQSQKEFSNAFNCALYIMPPSLCEEFSEETESTQLPLSLSQLPSISPFMREKFMQIPSTINPVTRRMLNFEKENTAKTPIIVSESGKVPASKKDVDEIMSKVKRPNTQRTGDWLCLKCNNLNFAFRAACNICAGAKTEYIQI
jgi:hypothetical protein